MAITDDPLDAELQLLTSTLDAMTAAATMGAVSTDDAKATRTGLLRKVAKQQNLIARRMVDLGTEHFRIAVGASDVEPDPKDKRFADNWFASNPLYRRMAQFHVANERAAKSLVQDLDLDDVTRLQAEFLVNVTTSALAPTNHLVGNPSALKHAWKTRGRSLVDGTRNVVRDLARNGGMPEMVDREPFTAGETIAATPGVVVFRHPVFELLRYTPTTEQVHERPVFVVPPQINKYYVLDLAPGRSLAEHLVGHGHQVFMVSWRNPTEEHRDWDLDTYVSALIEGTDAVRSLTGSPDLNALGVCAGGITLSSMASHLAAIGDPRLNSLSLLVTILDWEVPSTVGSLTAGPMRAISQLQSDSSGMLSAQELSRLFAWLRPNDLVWNYWVNNYLHGRKPAAYDVLAWNCDSTNLPAGLHRDFLEMGAVNAMAKHDAMEVLGTPLDLSNVTCDGFVVGAVTDHITPWQACFGTVNLLGGNTRFVLSSQGHIQALVNPSGNPKGSFQLNTARDGDRTVGPDEWLADAETTAGSWWDHWTEWLSTRSGGLTAAPVELGNADHPVIAEAPGSYVFG